MNSKYYNLIKKIIDKQVEGASIFTNRSSLWIIFAEEKKWVIELTEFGVLWYNSGFFCDIFDLVGLDEIENQNFITRWVENFIRTHVNSIGGSNFPNSEGVEVIIQNGIQHTEYGDWEDGDERFDDIIKNGVKLTQPSGCFKFEYLIQEIYGYLKQSEKKIEFVINDGIKKTP